MIYKLLTAEQKAAYLADDEKCPYCKAPGVIGGNAQCDSGSHVQNIHCPACQREWVDIHTLTEVGDGEQCCEECSEILHEGDDVTRCQPAGFAHTACLTSKETP